MYDINIGTPQGSVLGPLIFLLFVNDLPNYITHGRVYMYSDDTTIVVSDTDLSTLNKVNELLKEFSDWYNKNSLIIKYSKSTYIKFKNKYRITNNNFTFAFNNHDIKTVDAVSFLEITLDTHLD